MIRKALRRATYRQRIFVIALLLFVAGLFGAVGVTSAFFQAELDTKTATWAGGYVAVPTIGGVLPTTNAGSGYNGVITFTNGLDQTTTANEVQQIFGVDRGTTSNCTGATYSTTVTNSITSPTTASTFTYTDTGRATSPSNINGDWYCYEVVHGWPNTTAPVWTATATTNVQIGLAPTSVVINGGCTGDGKIDTSNSTAGCRFHAADIIAITYNQPVNLTGTIQVCQYTGTPAVILIGDATANCNTNADAFSVGKLTVSANGANKAHTNWTVSGSGTNTITLTDGQAGQNVTTPISAFVSSSNGNAVTSSTGSAAPCTSVASTCTLTVSGSF